MIVPSDVRLPCHCTDHDQASSHLCLTCRSVAQWIVSTGSSEVEYHHGETRRRSFLPSGPSAGEPDSLLSASSAEAEDLAMTPCSTHTAAPGRGRRLPRRRASRLGRRDHGLMPHLWRVACRLAGGHRRGATSESAAPGRLAAVLNRAATLPVQDAAPGAWLQPGRILLAPADHHLLVEPDGRVALSTAARVHSVRPAADILFASVAPVFTTRVIAVVLTGADSDGAQGIQRVKQWGGTVIAQDEASSEVFSMPRAAIATGAVDDILSLEQIAPALIAIAAARTRASSPPA